MGRTGLMEHLRYVYGPLEGRMARYTVQVENGGKLRWNLVDSRCWNYKVIRSQRRCLEGLFDDRDDADNEY